MSRVSNEGSRPGIRVLIADDNPVLRLAMRKLAERARLQADTVSNGREAVDSASRQRYDIVFLDVQMPELSGPEAAARLRATLDSDRPWLVGVSADPAFVGPDLAGMDEFLAKPIRFADLIGVLSRLGPRSNPRGGPRQRVPTPGADVAS